jgi:hypothetical protein
MSITVQDIFNQFYEQYKLQYTPSAQQAKAAEDIMNCRTSSLGGHVYECGECKHQEVRYNSCRNRHCPLCQGVTKAVWVDKRSQDILDAPYFHVIFTMPKELHQLIYQNKELLYSLMYKSVAETIAELCMDEKYLGAEVGFFSMLHTWGRDLHYHPHIHTVLLAGGLTKYDKWKNTSKDFFIPVKVLSKKFRGKFLYYLKSYYEHGKLKFYGDAIDYSSKTSFESLLSKCYSQSWYSYTQKTFSGPLAVIKYIGRYTHKIAISNSRIISMDEHTVTIEVKDYKDGNKIKTCSMSGVEFIRRFLMHVLPKRFVKVRYYGILSNRSRKTKLKLCKKLTASQTYKPKYEGLSKIEIVSLLLGRDVTTCPACEKGKMECVRALNKALSP